MPQLAVTLTVPFALIAPDAAGSRLYTHAPDGVTATPASAVALILRARMPANEANSVLARSDTVAWTQYVAVRPVVPGGALLPAFMLTVWLPAVVKPFCA